MGEGTVSIDIVSLVSLWRWFGGETGKGSVNGEVVLPLL